MSDPRFARLKTDPRFRRLKRKDAKIVVDERFKGIFDDGKTKGKKVQAGRPVDKYGRPVSRDHDTDDLRRFYRLEHEEEPEAAAPDYARGEAVLQSSDEEEDSEVVGDDESDDGGVVTLGTDRFKPIRVPEDDEDAEIDLNETNFADLDAQAIEYSHIHSDDEKSNPDVPPTRRLAVVNLDWDHVRAIHLYKIFSSLVSSSVSSLSGNRRHGKSVVRGKVLNVRVYPSEFGKRRLAREEKEGPPPEVFKKRKDFEGDEEVNEKNIIEIGDAEDYDEEALRKYQLERLRYYYAIVECDTVQAASHIHSELQGTELEYSANVFDLSYVPDDMTFDEEYSDEATEDLNTTAYRGLDFVTDALRHSKVKLTWDEDDPERNRITRRTLSRKEIEEADFKAYVASSTSGSESEAEPSTKSKAKNKRISERDKLRALLLGGGDEQLPEGWGDGGDQKADVDMEITFTPGLSEAKDDGKEETTLEKYHRKMKEKRKRRKEDSKEKLTEEGGNKKKDDFFSDESDDEREEVGSGSRRVKGEIKRKDARISSPSLSSRPVSTAEELALLASSDNPKTEHKHFDMKAVLKLEKSKGKRKKRQSKGIHDEDNELQQDFKIDVKDDRFTALHEDHTFAIDPSNPHFKKTSSMSALLEERSKRQRTKQEGKVIVNPAGTSNGGENERSLKSLVESVKRKSAVHPPNTGKRRKL